MGNALLDGTTFLVELGDVNVGNNEVQSLSLAEFLEDGDLFLDAGDCFVDVLTVFIGNGKLVVHVGNISVHFRAQDLLLHFNCLKHQPFGSLKFLFLP